MRKININFIKNKKIYFVISSVLIVAIAICTAIMGVQLDIQFKGGTIVDYSYIGTMDISEIENTVEDTINRDINISLKSGINGKDSFEITLTDERGLDPSEQSKLTDVLTEKFPSNEVELLSNNSVEPSMGREFFLKSLLGVAFAVIVLIIYIALRFKKISGWSAGVMAIIALLHDLFIVFGVFVIFRIPLDYNFIAVLLTILGYSVNDTIVIYDRIRESNRMLGTSISREELVNKSINDCLSRTLNTTITTVSAMIIVSVVSLLSGVTSILSFSFPMTIGLLSGTYSTICIAGPLWVVWQNHKAKKSAKMRFKPKKKAKNK